MEVATRIALLVLGLGIGDVFAGEPVVDEDRDSPIFVVRPPSPVSEPAPARSPVQLQLTSLLRSEIGPVALRAAEKESETNESGTESAEGGQGNLLRLEKMTVRAPHLLSPVVRETAVEKFSRTGYLWEFSPTKRFMIGPKGDKVGVMFSFDW